MRSEIEFKPRAIKDIQAFPKTIARRIMTKIEALEDDLSGDAKQLTNFTPGYRLRVGDYRVLFEVDRAKVIVYRVIHRKDAYK